MAYFALRPSGGKPLPVWPVAGFVKSFVMKILPITPMFRLFYGDFFAKVLILMNRVGWGRAPLRELG
jgi:hypothetical protein